MTFFILVYLRVYMMGGEVFHRKHFFHETMKRTDGVVVDDGIFAGIHGRSIPSHFLFLKLDEED